VCTRLRYCADTNCYEIRLDDKLNPGPWVELSVYEDTLAEVKAKGLAEHELELEHPEVVVDTCRNELIEALRMRKDVNDVLAKIELYSQMLHYGLDVNGKVFYYEMGRHLSRSCLISYITPFYNEHVHPYLREGENLLFVIVDAYLYRQKWRDIAQKVADYESLKFKWEVCTILVVDGGMPEKFMTKEEAWIFFDRKIIPFVDTREEEEKVWKLFNDPAFCFWETGESELDENAVSEARGKRSRVPDN
jgi:hypothetical protein